MKSSILNIWIYACDNLEIWQSNGFLIYFPWSSVHQYNLVKLALCELGQNFQNVMDVAISLVILV